MPDRRDRRRIHTPPKGVSDQLAPGAGEEPASWEGKQSLTPIHPTPVDEQTINETEEQANTRRISETKNASLTTLTGVEALRRDYRADIKEVHTKIDGVIEVQTQMLVVQGQVLGAVGESKGQNSHIIRQLDDLRRQRDNLETIDTQERITETKVHETRQMSDAEVGKARALSSIEVRKTAALKLIGGLAALIAAVVSGIGIERCGP